MLDHSADIILLCRYIITWQASLPVKWRNLIGWEKSLAVHYISSNGLRTVVKETMKSISVKSTRASYITQGTQAVKMIRSKVREWQNNRNADKKKTLRTVFG